MRRILFLLGCLSLATMLGTLPAAGQVPPMAGLPACERVGESIPPRSPRNVELSTVTDTEIVVTWLTCGTGRFPVATDTTVTYWPLGAPTERTTVVIGAPTAFHYARISGLAPNTHYGYTVSSNGRLGRSIV